jgi:hypothetical protein
MNAAFASIMNRSFLALALLLSLLSCARSTPPAAETPEGSQAPSTASASSNTSTAHENGVEAAPRREITIESIEVANPLVVHGRARTFENNVAIRLRDANGRLMKETFTTSRGEMGTHNPYEASVWLTSDPGSRITVEALEYSARDGSEQHLVSMTREFNLENIEGTLHFPNEACTALNRYRRSLPKTVAVARLLVEALMQGPTDSEKKAGARNPFPRGASVASINLKNGILTVDFNEQLQNVGGSCRAEMIRSAVTQTLMELPSVDRVVITAGGSEQLALQP